MARQPRYKAYRPSPIVHYIEGPKGNGLGIYFGIITTDEVRSNSNYPKAVNASITLLSPRKTSNKHQPNKLLKPRLRVGMDYDMIQVYDAYHKDQEFGRGLQIHCLAGGIGIAMIGRYRHGAKAGQVRDDAFMAHLVEGSMRETLKQFLGDVVVAKKKGLQVISMVLCYRDEKTLSQDTRMIWNSRMVTEELRLRKTLVCMVEEALGELPDMLPYHVMDEKSVCIGPERLIRIVDG
ncbi:unnamed protein product [Discula destructiva]